MLAVVDRVRLGGALLLLVAGAALFSVELIENRASVPESTHGYHCADAIPELSLAEAGALADRFYRDGRFEDAECVFRVVGDRQTPAKAEQLHVVASFYHQLGHSYSIALDRNAPDSLDHLDWALQFDAMLGGAFHDQLLAERASRPSSLDSVYRLSNQVRAIVVNTRK